MKRIVILVLVALSVGIAGCPGQEPRDARIGLGGEGVPLNVTEDGFRLNATIQNAAKSPPKISNVSVYLYRANETLISAKEAGSLVRETNISMESSDIPKYVIIYSPEFWDLDNVVEIEYYVRSTESPTDYTVELATAREDLPVIPETETA